MYFVDVNRSQTLQLLNFENIAMNQNVSIILISCIKLYEILHDSWSRVVCVVVFVSTEQHHSRMCSNSLEIYSFMKSYQEKKTYITFTVWNYSKVFRRQLAILITYQIRYEIYKYYPTLTDRSRKAI